MNLTERLVLASKTDALENAANMEKLKVSISSEGVQVVGNRRGLLGLAEICTRLANLPETRDDSRPLGNHYHYAEDMNNSEPGSVDLEILYDPEL